MNAIQIKRGEALLLQMAFQNDDGTPLDLTYATLSGQVRTPAGDLVAALSILPSDIEGVANVTVADTTQWPIGLLRGDVVLTAGGLTIHSDTYGITVTQGITR